MKRLPIILLVISAALLAACGGQPSADEILSQSADAMANVDTVSWVLTIEGGTLVLDPASGIEALGAQGVYQNPGEVYAEVNVNVGGIVATAQVVWNADGAFFALPPLQPSYQPLAGSAGYSPAIIFSTDQGIPYVLTNLLEDVVLQGEEDLDGVATYFLSADAQGEELAGLIGGAVETGNAAIDLWIDKATYQIVRVTVHDAAETTWTLDFYDYGQPVEIPDVN